MERPGEVPFAVFLGPMQTASELVNIVEFIERNLGRADARADVRREAAVGEHVPICVGQEQPLRLDAGIFIGTSAATKWAAGICVETMKVRPAAIFAGQVEAKTLISPDARLRRSP